MTGLTLPTKLQRPPVLRFGSGLAPTLGAWARDGGFKRVPVASAFDAAKVDLLELLASEAA